MLSPCCIMTGPSEECGIRAGPFTLTVISAVQMQVRRRIRKIVRVMMVSGEDSFHGMGRFYTGDFFIESTIGKNEAIMVNAQLMKDGGIEIPDMNRILCHAPAVVVGFSVGNASLDSTPGHPDGKGPPVVVSSRTTAVEPALLIDRAPEFPTPDDEGFVEQSPLLEVKDEGGRGLVRVLALTG